MIIYKVTNKINGKVYIGQTVRSLKQRRQVHENKSKHKTTVYFLRALKKHGIENFIWEVLCKTNSKSKLDALEKFYIACYKAITDVYNMTEGGEGFIGLKFSKEHKEKLSKAKKGKVSPKKGKPGKKHSAETRKKMSEARKGRVVSEETRRKIGQANKINSLGNTNNLGRKQSVATKEKISQHFKGRPWSQARREAEEHRRNKHE